MTAFSKHLTNQQFVDLYIRQWYGNVIIILIGSNFLWHLLFANKALLKHCKLISSMNNIASIIGCSIFNFTKCCVYKMVCIILCRLEFETKVTFNEIRLIYYNITNISLLLLLILSLFAYDNNIMISISCFHNYVTLTLNWK